LRAFPGDDMGQRPKLSLSSLIYGICAL
jgi:hypothetical protein